MFLSLGNEKFLYAWEYTDILVKNFYLYFFFIMPNKYSACNRQLVWDRNSYKNKAWGSKCSCSDEEKTSQQEDEVGGEAGGGALLHQAGAVTPGEEQ